MGKQKRTQRIVTRREERHDIQFNNTDEMRGEGDADLCTDTASQQMKDEHVRDSVNENRERKK